MAPAAPYTSWETAGTCVVEVVNAALANAAPRVVRLAAGTYYPTNTVNITAGLRLEGVDGAEVTILDGTHAGGSRGISITTDNYYTDDNLRQQVAGLTIRNYVSDASGAGLSASGIRRFDVRIEDCVFEANDSDTYGGGIAIYLSRVLVLADVKVLVTNCVFRANVSRTHGSGMGIFSTYGRVDIADCVFEDNTNANYGGALSYSPEKRIDRHPTTLVRCRFSNNLSGHQGGGALFHDNHTNLLISGCVFENNNARYRATWAASRQGGGLYAGGEGVRIENSRFEGNQGNVGGGIFAPHATLVNCLVAGNSAVTNAGGVYLETGTILNSTIAGNTAEVEAGGLYINGTGTATNSIFYENTAPVKPNYANAMGDTGLNFCCVTPAVTGTGNLNADPLFRNAAAGDYRLPGSSPCVNAGVVQNWMSGAPDLDGNPRVDLTFGLPDLGCYEKVFHLTMILIR